MSEYSLHAHMGFKYEGIDMIFVRSSLFLYLKKHAEDWLRNAIVYFIQLNFFVRYFVISYDRSAHSLPFATVEPEEISGSLPAEVHNIGMFL